MLILGDEGHYHGRFPWVTASLVVANVLVYVAQVFLGDAFTGGFALVPEEIVTFKDLTGTKYRNVKVEVRGQRDSRGRYHPRFETKQFPIKHYPGPFPIFLTLFTSMFLHGGILHLIGNMWFLLVFGRNVECALGPGRFLAFYTVCGIVGGLAHVASTPHSIIPCLGASGAISGVMGAYVSIHPFNKIKVWFGWMIGAYDVPALAVIGFWFLMQYLSAFWTLEHDANGGGVAYWCHVGGFVAGFVIIRAIVFYLQRQAEHGMPDEEEPLVASEGEVLSLPMTMNEPASTGIAAGEPDPLARFLSVKTMRKTPESTASVSDAS